MLTVAIFEWWDYQWYLLYSLGSSAFPKFYQIKLTDLIIRKKVAVSIIGIFKWFTLNREDEIKYKKIFPFWWSR